MVTFGAGVGLHPLHQITIKLYTAILRDIPHRLMELDFLFFDSDGIYERFKNVA